MKRALLAFCVVVLMAMALAAPAAANDSAQTFSYVVKPGDTLSSIARQNCTTWQEIYHGNRAVIGPYPNVLRPGTVLVVTNRCGGVTSTPSPGGCNLGPIPHAMGPVSGNIYTVVPGDTLFSIGRRFCTTPQQLAAANGIPNPWRIFAGQRLVIPGLSSTPSPSPSPSPSPGARYLTISAPTSGAVLPPTFTVSGTGAGLFEGNVVVTAFTNSGQFLAQRATTLQGSNVGTGGAGTWSTQLTVNVAAGTPGYIQATSPQSNVPPAQVSVTYGTPAAATLRIVSPAANASLPATFPVSGTASGLPLGSTVTVQARNTANQVLASQTATLLGGGEPGTSNWSTTLTVNAAPGTAGSIVATAQAASASATVPVTFNGGASAASITITSPTGGAVLPVTFVVNGNGTGLVGGTVTVWAQNSQGQVLDQRQVPLQGANGQGVWTATLTVNTTPGTPGFVVASSPGTTAIASVPVTFGGSMPPIYHNYAPGQCRVQGRPGAPLFNTPNGQQSGQFVAGGVWYDVPVGAKTGSQFWYQVNLDPGTGNPPQWAPSSSIATMLSTCVW